MTERVHCILTLFHWIMLFHFKYSPQYYYIISEEEVGRTKLDEHKLYLDRDYLWTLG